MREKIVWLGHSSVKIGGDRVIYIDPWKLRNPEKADIVLVSHSHHDHLSTDDIEKIRHGDTVIIATADSASQISGDVRTVKPGDTVRVDDVTIEAVPSYNIDKAFHPRRKNWVGFLITVGGTRIYYCGDTDFIPEMHDISADIVIAPVGGTYTMTADEAAAMVKVIKPEVAIPVHYGDIVGSIEDAERFRYLAECAVEIKPVGMP